MTKLITTMTLALLLTACSFHWKDDAGNFQHRGMLWHSLTQTDQARFFELQTFGFQIRLQPEDTGGNFGYRKYIALQPPLNDQQSEPKINSGFFICEEAISNGSALLFRTQLGLEAGRGLLINGFSLGYNRVVIIEGPPSSVSVIKKIDFHENKPLLTSVYQSSGVELP